MRDLWENQIIMHNGDEGGGERDAEVALITALGTYRLTVGIFYRFYIKGLLRMDKAKQDTH